MYVDGNKIIETTKGKGPLTYVHGKSQLLETLEKGLEGMKKGQKRNIVIGPEEAYGEVKKEFIIEYPLEKIPEGSAKEGERLAITGKDGKEVICVVKKIKKRTAILDFNHPLAGKSLRYRVKIIDVKDLRQLG